MTLAPQIEGTVPIRSSAAQFVQAFHYRVAAGLLVGQPHPRSNYRVAEAGPGQLRIHAADWWTAINVGLNEFVLRLPQPGSVHYWRSEEHTSELQSRLHLVCRLLLEKKKHNFSDRIAATR